VGRILCIDYGQKRVGLALSDTLKLISTPFAIIYNDGELLQNLQALIEDKLIEKIVIGMPYTLDGRRSKKTKEVEKFVQEIKRKINLPVTIYDEAFSTVEANEILKRKGLSAPKARRVVDMYAASIILSNYLQNL